MGEPVELTIVTTGQGAATAEGVTAGLSSAIAALVSEAGIAATDRVELNAATSRDGKWAVLRVAYVPKEV